MLRTAAIIFGKDLRQRLRDRSALLVAIVAPVLLAGLIGTATGGRGAAFQLRFAIEEADAAAFEPFVRFLSSYERGDSELVVYSSRALAAAAVDRGEVDALLRLEDQALEVGVSGDRVFSARAAQAVADRYLASLAAGALPPAVRSRSPGGGLRMVDYFAATMSVLFLNFAILGGVRSLEEEKQSGALARLAAAPISPHAVLLGKFVALIATGLLQFAVLIAATAALFGTRWGAPVPLAALVLSSVLMAVGMTSVFMILGGNADRGNLIATVAIFVLAVLGGQFMPPQGLPDVFETLQRLVPNGQAARGLVDLAAAGPGAGIGAVLEPLAYTAAVGVAGLLYALRGARDALHRAAE